MIFKLISTALKTFVLAIVVIIFVCPTISFAKKIALSFDDIPRQEGLYYNAFDRADLLVNKLKNKNVVAAFFCNPPEKSDPRFTIIEKYSTAGHFIANHTKHHLDAEDASVQEFLDDIDQAHSLLFQIPNFRQWFRYPYLREGDYVSKRDDIRKGLNERGYQHGYVTVDNYDYYMDVLFQEALEKNLKIDFDKLEKLFVNVLFEGINFYDSIAKKTFNRSPVHVLLLHETDLSVLLIDKLIDHLRANGWEIVSPEEAYSDPIAALQPSTLRTYMGLIAALAIDNNYSGPIKTRWQSEKNLAELFNDNEVFQK